MEKSRTRQALDMMRTTGASQSSAAKRFDVSGATLSRARRSEDARAGKPLEPRTGSCVNRTRNALALLDADPKLSIPAAAAEAGLAVTVLRRAVKVRKQTAHMRCKHCGAKLPYAKNVFTK